MKAVSAIITASLLSSAAAFAPTTHSKIAPITSLEASFDPLNFSEPAASKSDDAMPIMKFAATAAASIALHPLAAIAEEDDYEYGAVDAPIGLAWAVGLLAILTALLPLALKGGEEAFEEMKSTDADTWGTGNSNKLNKKR